MPYQAGPFGQATAADIHVAPGVYNFTDDAAGLQGDLEAIGVPWDSIITDLFAFAAEPWDAQLGLDIDGMLGLADVYGAAMPPSTLGDALAGWFDTQSMLDAATSFAPAQAWLDPGAPFEIPDSALTLVPTTVNPAAFVPSVNFTVGGGGLTGDRQVSLFNRTRVGSLNFIEGDEFQLLAIGNPGDDVTAAGSLNAVDLGTTDYGQIDSTGQMILSGTMGPDAVGVWSQQWSVAGELLGNFNFVVAPAGN